MNFDTRIQRVTNMVDQVNDELRSVVAEYKAARDFTEGFLAVCKNHGIKTVSIGQATELIPESVDYAKVFSPRDSVFASERDGTWPAIWAAVEECGISGGCGNTGQHQVSRDAMAKLVDGVYELRDGKWNRRD